LVSAAVGNRSWQLSEQRARLISIAGVGGLLAGFGLLFIIQPTNADNSLVLFPLGGSLAGLALGTKWTRHMPKDAMPDVRGSRLGFQPPSVQPMLLDRGRDRVPALGVNLIQARF
jgi:hypothetical protein